MEMEIDGKVLRLETGEVGRLAAGAVVARMGNSVLYSTACGDLWEDKEETVEDFVPLSVHYQERSSAAGKTPGEVPLAERCGCATMRSGLFMPRAPKK
jgi:polyribonucleotide nucleotidyltransferase